MSAHIRLNYSLIHCITLVSSRNTNQSAVSEIIAEARQVQGQGIANKVEACESLVGKRTLSSSTRFYVVCSALLELPFCPARPG
jgi:hypothetical protein